MPLDPVKIIVEPYEYYVALLLGFILRFAGRSSSSLSSSDFIHRGSILLFVSFVCCLDHDYSSTKDECLSSTSIIIDEGLSVLAVKSIEAI